MFNFGSAKKQTVPQPVPQPVPEIVKQKSAVVIQFPSAKIPVRAIESQKQQSYSDAAKSIGFYPAGLVLAQLSEFFEDEKIKLYDYNQVVIWLKKKREEAGAEGPWCWRPLREKDIITEYKWGTRGAKQDGFYQNGWECRPYDLLIPQHALEKVVKIETAFKDQVKFFVSFFDKPGEDPFIMVRPNMATSESEDMCCFVFDVWDEPGFGL
jgi:hypothetical protein